MIEFIVLTALFAVIWWAVSYRKQASRTCPDCGHVMYGEVCTNKECKHHYGH